MLLYSQLTGAMQRYAGKVWLRLTKAVRAGEEITVAYGPKYRSKHDRDDRALRSRDGWLAAIECCVCPVPPLAAAETRTVRILFFLKIFIR